MIQTKEQLDALCYAQRSTFLNRLDITGLRIIDIGCGDGRFTLEHFGDAASVYGVDTKQEEIDKANQSLQESPQLSNGQFRFDCADIVDHPLPRHAFDIAIFLRSF